MAESYTVYDFTAQFVHKNILLGSPAAELILSVSGAAGAPLLAKDPPLVLQLGHAFLSSLALAVVPAGEGWVALLDTDEDRRTYLAVDMSRPDRPVVATAGSISEAACFKIMAARGQNQPAYLFSRAAQEYLSVRLDRNLDPEGAMFPVTAAAKSPIAWKQLTITVLS